MVEAIVHEIKERKTYLQNSEVETIYFGGGTPSLLSDYELQLILNTIKTLFQVNQNAEITIECNPEDITSQKLLFYKSVGINRLSIGIQTFNNQILQFLNRVHDRDQAIRAVHMAKEYGFENITIDLMYALPKSDAETLKADITKAVSLNVPHISAYCFTLEEKTAFGKMVKQNKLKENDDSFEQEQYEIVLDMLKEERYEQYEISNFAREERYSKHNTAYWFGREYLGIGPGAHSFNGLARQWNIANNQVYIQKMNAGEQIFDLETLTEKDIYTESIMIQLRTKWGVNVQEMNKKLGLNFFDQKKEVLAKLVNSGHLIQTATHLFLTEKGKLLTNGIVLDLMD